MRSLTGLIIALAVSSASAWTQQEQVSLTAPAQAEARMWDPGSSFFYINGIAYRYAAASSYAVVAAATTGVGGKYLGVKVHVFNRSRQSITVRPEDITVVDAIAKRRLAPVPAVEIVNRKRGEPNWMRFAGTVAAGGTEPVGDLVNPQWSDLVRALQPEVTSSARADSTTAVYSSQKVQVDGPDCDTACQLRNREVNSTLSSGWQQNLAESIQHTAFLANTIPPQCDVEGVLYFPMPRQAATDPSARHRSKSYAITISVPVAGERFNLDFPVE
jgi:hypothetical protein